MVTGGMKAIIFKQFENFSPNIFRSLIDELSAVKDKFSSLTIVVRGMLSDDDPD